MYQVNVNVAKVRREFPNWSTRARIRKVNEAGDVLPNEYAYGGEIVRVSPRYQKNGTNFRIRPERPAVFFSHFLFENGLIPVALTPEESESEAGLEILQPLWDGYKGYFPKLESPYAAGDQSTEPSLKGFSYNVMQVLVETIGIVRTNGSGSLRPVANSMGQVLEEFKKRIEAMRARNGSQSPLAPRKKS